MTYAEISTGVVERNLSSFVDALQHTFDAEELATEKEDCCRVLDPRIKIAGVLPLIVIAALARQLRVIVVLFAVALAMALLSKVPLGTLAKRVWLAVLAFTGRHRASGSVFDSWPAHLPSSACRLERYCAGVSCSCLPNRPGGTAATLSVLVVLCTPWNDVLKALRVLRVPSVLVVILGMTYRYIFLLLRSAHDMFEARKSRMLGDCPAPNFDEWLRRAREC